MLNHFNFKRFGADLVLITNDFGGNLFLSQAGFKDLVMDRVAKGTPLYERLREGRFLLDPPEVASPDTAEALRAMKSYLFSGPSLHIFVLTNACDLRCVYCQARGEADRGQGYMSAETGRRCVEMALCSPAKRMTFEFQGGEPLLDFPVMREMIEYTQRICGERAIDFTVVSNLSLLTEEMLDFFQAHRVSICTSLDGPEDLHDRNRPCADRSGSYARMKAGIAVLERRGYPFSAIETTTRHSLPRAREIVRTYEQIGARGIFLRPLTPLGAAKAAWDEIGYTPEEYVAFYSQALQEVLRVNREKRYFPEQHAVYFLSKILGGYAHNYMELRSPCGAAIGQLAYDYDGSIYTCDEARMVAGSGDSAFRVGDVFTSTYQELMDCGTCRATCAASTTETLPGCCDCVYQPYCGACPVVSYASGGDIFPRSMAGYRCAVVSGMLDLLFGLLLENDKDTVEILRSWVCGQE